ncbi:OsmC family protein [Streptomyces camelliae]|uniref:Osmotically inducible protein OsmC n=1 Tax=Streptomyces camelliae TaxID=3004093 RepID=A0ABY7P494_9ACTN|nr:hypothetical protein [Streptomyces sp. HUAS 2-6]WBO65130.1 hypothetical protein O1G22_20975 [Streptomyces sp. HUAS 2-6]
MADFAVEAPAGPARPGTVASRTLTARCGTTRLARDFRLVHRSAAEAGASPDPSPYETALAAMASCVLVTQVNGFTARGVNLGGLSVVVSADLPLDDEGRPAAGQPLENIRWRSDVECVAPAETVCSINHLTTAFSPNHRVFLDASPFDAITAGGRPMTWEPAPPVSRVVTHSAVLPLEVTAVWEYGSEASFRTVTVVDGVRQESGPFGVDQAKQMLGIDRAPNSQEILLSSLVAELTGLLGEEASVPGFQIRAAGRLDTRGMLNVLREIPSRFHRLTLEVTGPQRSKLPALVGSALSRSVIAATLAHERTVGVEAWHNNVLERSYVSATKAAEAVRDELTSRSKS